MEGDGDRSPKRISVLARSAGVPIVSTISRMRLAARDVQTRFLLPHMAGQRIRGRSCSLDSSSIWRRVAR